MCFYVVVGAACPLVVSVGVVGAWVRGAIELLCFATHAAERWLNVLAMVLCGTLGVLVLRQSA